MDLLVYGHGQLESGKGHGPYFITYYFSLLAAHATTHKIAYEIRYQNVFKSSYFPSIHPKLSTLL